MPYVASCEWSFKQLLGFSHSDTHFYLIVYAINGAFGLLLIKLFG